ncbi:MAG: hypothetical protein ACK45I_07045 [Bacteroidota bacterium]
MKIKYKISAIKVYTRLVYLLLCCTFTGKANADTQAKKWLVDLYGHTVSIEAQPALLDVNINTQTVESAKSSLLHLMQLKETDSLYNRLIQLKKQYAMDDVALLMLIKKVNAQVFSHAPEGFKQLLLLALLHKHQIDLMAGFSNGQITVYARTNFLIDNCLFIQRGNKLYYDLSFDQKKNTSAEEALSIPEHTHALPLVMNMLTPPAFGAKTHKQIIPFEYDGFMYYFSARINVSLTSYYRELPTISINTVYLNYGVSESVRQSLIKELKRAVYDMRTEVAVDFILKFTQQSFDYRKDEDVYGVEKFSFPEETLVNRFSDCEDKAMLFASMIREVLGLKSVALYYKDAQHINVAIQRWSTNMNGNVQFNDEKYIVCEPTMKGFAIGQNSLSTQVANLIDW